MNQNIINNNIYKISMMKKFILLTISAMGNAEAIKLNTESQLDRPFTLGRHLAQEYALSNTTTEEQARLEARLGLMTKVTISNTHLSLKMERNKVIAKQIVQALREAVRA